MALWAAWELLPGVSAWRDETNFGVIGEYRADELTCLRRVGGCVLGCSE